jgi:transcriptional regulator with XRE-family HTH domain
MANDICVTFGRRLRRLRQEKGWKQIDLAVHAEIGRTYVSKLENGKIEPGLRQLKTLSDSLEISVSQLLKGL